MRSGETVDSILGAPDREWGSKETVWFAEYTVKSGVEPSLKNAAFITFLDLMTVGLMEPVWLVIDSPAEGPPRGRVVIAYDPSGKVIGIFDASQAELPKDGQSRDK